MDYFTLLFHYRSNDRYADILRSDTPVSFPKGTTVTISEYAISIENFTYNHASYVGTYNTSQVSTVTVTGNMHIYLFYSRNDIPFLTNPPYTQFLPYEQRYSLYQNEIRVVRVYAGNSAGAINIEVSINEDGKPTTGYYWLTNQSVALNVVTGEPVSYISKGTINLDGSITREGRPILDANTTYWIWVRNTRFDTRSEFVLKASRVNTGYYYLQDRFTIDPYEWDINNAKYDMSLNMPSKSYYIGQFTPPCYWRINSTVSFSTGSGSSNVPYAYICTDEPDIDSTGTPTNYIYVVTSQTVGRLRYDLTANQSYYFVIVNKQTSTLTPTPSLYHTVFYTSSSNNRNLYVNKDADNTCVSCDFYLSQGSLGTTVGYKNLSSTTSVNCDAGELLTFRISPKPHAAGGRYILSSLKEENSNTTLGTSYFLQVNIPTVTTQGNNYNFVAHFTEDNHPFSWSTPKVTGQEVNISASEWNRFREYAFDKCGYSDKWLPVSAGDSISANVYNIAAEHIGLSTRVQSGDVISASLINALVTKLNSI